MVNRDLLFILVTKNEIVQLFAGKAQVDANIFCVPVKNGALRY